MSDLQDFLDPIPGETPSGTDLRNDARFHAIERVVEPARRTARQEAAEIGTQVQVDWRSVIADARDLASSGRDLRLLVILVRALMAEEGMGGLSRGLDLLSETVESYWDSLHPALREGPPQEAAMRRINALKQVENPDTGLLGDLEFLGLFEIRPVGVVTGGDLATGGLKAAQVLAEAPRGLGAKETAAITSAHEARANRVIGACRALMTERAEEFAQLSAGISGALAALSRLETALGAKLGTNGSGPRFTALSTMLQRMAATLQSVAASSEPAAEPDAPAAQGSSASPLQIASRRDVERCLDLIIDFYERTEPSSPIPHLARRMRRMVPMNFLQLMEEVAPSGMKEFRAVAGVAEEKTK
ncbi:type VI secretion system protein TssA [Rhodobacter sp. NSM]|uniref:type VI secretion system protein TssA n=1 Tax=Rhodobacter sp. NSM TaxID=3457501 RepID=UPI003FD6B6E0